jgi:hypothetical protein
MLRLLFALTLILLIICALFTVIASTLGRIFPGALLAFNLATEGSNANVNVLDLSHGIQINVGMGNYGTPPVWNNDGRLVMVSNLFGSLFSEIYVWDGTKLIDISQNPEAQDINPTWSVDGRLAFTSMRDSNRDIYLWDGLTVSNITRSADWHEYNPTWSVDGQLAFVAVRDVTTRIYVWDGATLTHVSHDLEADSAAPVWSIDGRLVFNVWIEPYRQLFVLDDGILTNISEDPNHNDILPAWSNDGQLAFVSWGLEGAEVKIWDGSTTNSIASFSDGYIYGFTWSADGRLAFVVVDANNNAVLYIWDGLSLSSPGNLNSEDSPTWSDDGRLAFSSYSNGIYSIYLWDEGTLSQVTQSSDHTTFLPSLWTP